MNYALDLICKPVDWILDWLAFRDWYRILDRPRSVEYLECDFFEMGDSGEYHEFYCDLDCEPVDEKWSHWFIEVW